MIKMFQNLTDQEINKLHDTLRYAFAVSSRVHGPSEITDEMREHFFQVDDLVYGPYGSED